MLYVGLTNGGFGWIPNLTDVDHSFILPISMAFANLAIIQVIYSYSRLFYSQFLIFLNLSHF